MVDLKKLILQSREYDEDFVKELLITIIAERKKEEEQEKEEQRKKEEKEEQNKREEKEEQRKKEEKEERNKREEKEEQREEKEREFELEKLRIEATTRLQINTLEQPDIGRIVKPKFEIHKLMQKFNVKENDISLYLILFERQACRAQVGKNDWVSHLLGLLPSDIVQLIAREPEEVSEDYDHVKKLLLTRFKLSPERFRQMFVRHQRNLDLRWQDFVYELRNYFHEWISGLGISTFEQLSDLMITDQLKRRVPSEMREHFIDEWSQMASSSELATKLDDYEDARENVKKITLNGQKEKNFPRWKSKFPPEGSTKKENFFSKKDSPSWKTKVLRNSANYDTFEKRKHPQCFKCGSYDHFRPQCPKFKSRKSLSGTVNQVAEMTEVELLSPYTTMGRVNGFQMPVLRDSGASIDVVCRKYITPDMLTGENIWVQQPLDAVPTCLPLAEVELTGDFGHIITKAAVIRNELDQGRYLLGNRTAVLIAEKKRENKNADPYHLNAVRTRAQRRLQEPSENSEEVEDSAVFVEDVPTALKEDSGLLPPPEMEDHQGCYLLKITQEDFITSQNQSMDLKTLFELASRTTDTESSKEFMVLENKLLVKRQTDKTGVDRYLLIVPEEFREKLKTLCHEGTSGHLGVTKTKDLLARHFFWPRCYKEIEDYVRSCDQCQRAGKPNDRKKAPMKLVPVIQEVFSKINVDACGPLPTTPSGKRYIITAMCLSSKYPDAVAVNDIGSVSVVDALLQIFSRMGFPKEIQCDQGTSFMSALTTEFLERFGIKVTHSSVHHPQSNPIERFHRTIKRILRVLCLEATSNWENHICPALFALRTVKHETTGFTPAELVHGRNLRTPLTLLYEHWMEPEEEGNSVVEYVFQLINRLKRCQEVAVNTMKEQQVKTKTYYDKKTIKREFKEGDLVLVLATTRPNKLAVQWTGPGTIQSKISDTNYIVHLPGKNEKSQIYHVNMLKPYYQRPDLINFLACSEKDEQQDLEIIFPGVESDPNVFNFAEIIQESHLEEKLNNQQIQQLQELLSKYSKSFSNKPGVTHLVEHDIELISDKPIRAKPYRMSPRQTEILKTEIQKMLQYKVIEIGESDYTSPMILVEAPCKEPRPCIDYRRLNEIIRTKYYPLPNIEQRVETVAAAKFITILNFTLRKVPCMNFCFVKDSSWEGRKLYRPLRFGLLVVATGCCRGERNKGGAAEKRKRWRVV